MELYQFLEDNSISYERCDHPAVFTVEEANRLVPPLPGAKTKNLFLRDRRGKRHFLVVVPGGKQINLKKLSPLLDAKNVSFASPERLLKHLGITPGAVSMLALFNDKQKNVELFIDQELWEADSFLCHPLVNTATLVISKEGMNRFFDLTQHNKTILEIPVQS